MRQALLSAFAGLPPLLHSDIPIHQSSYADYEGERVAAALVGRAWQEIDADYLQTAYSGDRSAMLGFMSNKAFCYFLPSFLSIALEFERSEDVASAACAEIVRRGSGTRTTCHDAYSAIQRGVVRECLEHLKEQYVEGGFPTNPAGDALMAVGGW